MTTKDVEEWAVTKVKDAIITSGYLDQFISENDREPSFDGKINVYNSSNKTKADFVGSVNIQVKGTQTEDLSADVIKFDVDIIDLKAYLANGGAIYFVVYVTSDYQYKIYYKSLLPVKIYGILNNCTAIQKTKRLEFFAFPDNGNRKAEIFSNFYQNSKSQHSFSEETMISIEELTKGKDITKISTIVTGYGANRNIEDSFLENEVYLYATKRGTDIKIPIKMIPEEMSITECSEALITANGRLFYKNIRRVKTKAGTKVLLGKSISVFFNKQGEKKGLNVNYDLVSNLNDQVIDLDFFLNMIEANGFEFNGKRIAVNAQSMIGLNVTSLQRRLELVKKIKFVFEKLHIKKDLDFKKLTEDDKIRLSELIAAFYDGKTISNWKKELPLIFTIAVQDIRILLVAKKVEEQEGTYIIYDFFDSDLSFVYEYAGDEKKYITTLYSVLTTDDYCKIDNVNYGKIVAAYAKAFEVNPDLLERANYDMLNLLEAYDRKGEREMLESVEKLCDWIAAKEKEKTISTLLNKLQILKRRRRLSNTEKDNLYKIIEGVEVSEEEKIGAYILLENKRMARKHLQDISEERRENFKQYPIYKRFLSRKK